MTINISGKTLAVSAAMLVLGGLAVAGWTRRSAAPEPPAAATSAPPAPTPEDPVPPTPPEAQSGYIGDWQPVRVSRRPEQAPMQPAEDSTAAPPPGTDDSTPDAAPPQDGPSNGGPYDAYGQPESNAAPAPSNSGYPSSQAPVRQGRSRTKSVEIVAGSAAGGAAIGALAGGGKGAAIGALSGGAAGFVYDRLTHNQ